jgi:predicted phosphoribosyltransferase
MQRFRDRRDAGRQLAERLAGYRDQPDVVVLGLPRGGVPVAHEIATRLNLALDVYIVRKLGTPMHEELAMGAIASNGARILNDSVIRSANVPQSEIDRVSEKERQEIQRRERKFRGDRERIPLEGKTVILVDDGLATGATMKAAVEAVKSSDPDKIVVAVGTAPRETVAELSDRDDIDEVVSILTPEVFFGVGGFYENFAQTTDEEVAECLKE